MEHSSFHTDQFSEQIKRMDGRENPLNPPAIAEVANKSQIITLKIPLENLEYEDITMSANTARAIISVLSAAAPIAQKNWERIEYDLENEDG